MANYQELANNYYAEYQTKSIDELEEDLQRWESANNTIRNMPLAERATYADYVTKKMCENHHEIALEYTRSDVIPMLNQINYSSGNTCGIANLAAHLMLLPEDERAQYDVPIAGALTCTIC